MRRNRLATAVVAVALATGACTTSDSSTGAPVTTGVDVTPLPAASMSSTTTTTTTLAVPDPPPLGEGSVCDLFDGAVTELGRISNVEITEASGIAAATQGGALWVVNDSGNEPVLYAVAADGSDLGATELEGASGFDWEALAIGPGPDPDLSYIYIGDIGDNLRIRSTLSILRFPEPDPTNLPATLGDFTTIRLTYPEDRENAEAMWVDPVTGDLFVATKREEDGSARVYRVPADSLHNVEPIEMTLVARLRLPEGAEVTAADTSRDGAVLALRGYDEVWMWVRRDLTYEQTLARRPCRAPSPEEIQGEAIAFLPDELAYVTLSEGALKPINLVRSKQASIE